ncbi:MAG TPA: VTT domain-containing protein [Bryobacteraceae bacterium]|nr:VTT domain-containing protein [Bryobacteraceae bacterium]
MHFVFHIGYFGPVVMGVLDSSFLFLPFGNDLLVIALVARHHQGYLLYALAATCGSVLGVFLLDLAARKAGGSGVKKMAGKRRFDHLKKKIGEHGTLALLLGCLAPPPFPFTMAVVTLSALKYPRWKMLLVVAAGRGIRFLLLGFLALKYGRLVMAVARSSAFTYTMGVLVALCVIGSIISISKWFRRAPGRGAKPAEATA